MDDASIIQLFWDRQEQAIEETDKKYGRLCFRLAYNILNRNEDSEECVSDTYFNIWNSIPDDRPEHFTAYICQIVKRIALKKFRYNRAYKRNEESVVPIDDLSYIVSGKDNPEDMAVMKELSRSISTFLMQQKNRERQMFIRRYWYYDSIENIAELFQMNPRTVSTVLFRMRNRLKKFLVKEGYEL